MTSAITAKLAGARNTAPLEGQVMLIAGGRITLTVTRPETVAAPRSSVAIARNT